MEWVLVIEVFGIGLLVTCLLVGLSIQIKDQGERIVALNDQQERELLDAIAGVGTQVEDAANRVAALIEAQNIADPEVTAAISELRDIGTKAGEIAANPPAPDPGP